MTGTCSRRLAWLAFFAVVSELAALGQPPPAAEDPAKANEASLATMKAMASRYELTAGAKNQFKLDRTAEPVQRWTNPVRGQPDGCLYLWTLAGRPQAALTIYPRLDGTAWNHEFQSLATTPLVAKYDGEEAWTPDQPGVEFRLVPAASAPADSAARRLVQMRAIARGFAATVDVRGDKSALRLLTAPIYRYEGGSGDPLDGAVFVFAQATDPEMLLLLEARAGGGKPQWHYALARSTLWPLAATYESQQVWSVEKWNRATAHIKQPYLDRPRPEK